MGEIAGKNGGRDDLHRFVFRPEQTDYGFILLRRSMKMRTFVGPNGRIYRKPRRRWSTFALVAAVLMVAGVTVNAMRPVKTANAAQISELEPQR